MEARFPNVRSKIPNTFPPVRNLYDRISFGWVRDLMRRGNEVPLELTDVFLLPPHQQMAHTAEEFEAYFSEERSRSRAANYSVARYETEKVNILVEFWKSPLTRAIVRMYRKEFLLSGVTKFFNTLSQFLPSLIVSRILAYVDGAKQAQGALNSADSVWQLLLQKRMGLQLSVLLLACLSLKTIIENQYFDRVSRFSAEIRGAISTAIYRKALRLSPQSRKNNTLGEIVNYMQLDTGRIEYVAGSVSVLLCCYKPHAAVEVDSVDLDSIP